MSVATNPHADEKESFAYFRDEEEPPNNNESESLPFSFLSVGSFLRQWWIESLWPGMGLFGESYLLFSIGTLTPLWKELYPHCWDASSDESGDADAVDAYDNDWLSTEICSPRLLESLTYGVVLGVIAGMVLLGYFANHFGRRRGSILTAALMAGGSLSLLGLSMFGVGQNWSPSTILGGTVAGLSVFGIGVGGEYPLSASLASEKATEEMARNKDILVERERQWTKGNETATRKSNPLPSSRGRRVQLVFAMQGMGIWFNSLTMLALLWALTSRSNEDNVDENFQYEYDPGALVTVWRVTYGIGALVLCFVLLTRIWCLEESKVWLEAKQTSETNRDGSAHNSAGTASHDLVPTTNRRKFKLVHRQYGSRMFGAGMAWLLWDISFYGNKLFQSTFLLAVVGENAGLTELTAAAALNATIALLGYYGAALLIDRPRPSVGRKNLQSIGLVATGGLFLACGWLASSSSSSTTVALYLLSSFVGQLGPNCTTFLIPAEIVPTDQRTYCHGVCAASGKVGALLAAVLFHFVGGSNNDKTALFRVCGAAGVAGALVTHVFVPETAGLDLLELDLQWKILLEEGGDGCYDGPAVQGDHLSLYERYRIG